jgi:ABC-type branched-subunit amino acid transport system substrate-binding protein
MAKTMRAILTFGWAMLVGVAPTTAAEKNYAPGITDTEIKIGQTMPYSGPASPYGAIGKAELAYFKMLNEHGGINGRKINLISLDDGYNPPKTVEQIRRLVEQDQVAFIFQSLGDVTNVVVQKYLNDRKIPQLFLADGSSRWDDPQHFPWTMPWQPSYRTEGHVDAKYVLQHKPDAKIGVLYQNSEGGLDYVKGLKEGLGDKAATMIVKEESYEVTDTTIDSQIVALQAAGADTFFNITIPKFAAQAIRKAYDIGWRPLQFLGFVSSSVSVTLEPAGLDKSIGIYSVAILKDPANPQWQDDPATIEWTNWMDKYNPQGDKRDGANVYAYLIAQTLVHVLEQCGDDLSRENIMRQAANLHKLSLPLLLPGITINTSPTDFRPVKQMQPMRFDGKRWELLGEPISG